MRSAWLHFAACGLVGVATAYAYVWIAQVSAAAVLPSDRTASACSAYSDCSCMPAQGSLCPSALSACLFSYLISMQHYTDYAYGPVKTIAEASTTGHATTIIAGPAAAQRLGTLSALAGVVVVLAPASQLANMPLPAMHGKNNKPGMSCFWAALKWHPTSPL